MKEREASVAATKEKTESTEKQANDVEKLSELGAAVPPKFTREKKYQYTEAEADYAWSLLDAFDKSDPESPLPSQYGFETNNGARKAGQELIAQMSLTRDASKLGVRIWGDEGDKGKGVPGNYAFAIHPNKRKQKEK